MMSNLGVDQSNSSEKQDDKKEKVKLFSKFDCVEDHSDHFYNNNKDSSKQKKNFLLSYFKYSSSWKKKIRDEWKMLEKDLPDTIHVRIYEARMDLLRALIVGADGTPYHDGLFFFDVHFTPSYPSAPPLVNYHAHGLRINPNLYRCGNVCLSLLGTWGGSGTEKWQPKKSNMLQILLSIQALILNAEPYYNEPGYADIPNLATQSEQYNENIFILSLKTMLYTMKNPPKYFEDLVYGHFHERAHAILSACRAYLDGTKVGSFVKCKIQDTQGKGEIQDTQVEGETQDTQVNGKSQDTQVTGGACSQFLRMNLPSQIKSLMEAFTEIGVMDCEKYLVPVPSDPKPLTKSR